MKKYLAPLGVFVGGNLLLLVAFLFFAAFGTAGDAVAANASGYGDTFWGLTWVTGSFRLLIYVVLELIILFGTAVAFIRVKD